MSWLPVHCKIMTGLKFWYFLERPLKWSKDQGHDLIFSSVLLLLCILEYFLLCHHWHHLLFYYRKSMNWLPRVWLFYGFDLSETWSGCLLLKYCCVTTFIHNYYEHTTIWLVDGFRIITPVILIRFDSLLLKYNVVGLILMYDEAGELCCNFIGWLFYFILSK